MSPFTELAFQLLKIGVGVAIQALRSDEPIDEEDRATLARAAELSAELMERKKFGAS